MNPAFAELVAAGEARTSRFADDLRRTLHRHAPAELMRLLLDAIFLGPAHGAGADRKAKRAGPADSLVGWLSAEPDLVQLQANVLGRTIEVPSVTDSGTLGAAMLAAMRIGTITRLPRGHADGQLGRAYHPASNLSRYYDMCSRRFTPIGRRQRPG